MITKLIFWNKFEQNQVTKLERVKDKKTMTWTSWIVSTYACLNHRNTLKDSQKVLEKI
jgi:hypothetical protein